jgi:OOP family OmpA-OmpF porin
MRLRSALLAAAVLALPVAVKAQPVTGLYVGGGAGLNFLQDEFTNPSPALHTPKLKADFINPGLASEAAMGYGLGNGFRFELEGNYNYNHLHKLEGTGFPTAAGGENQEYGAMVNALYDFDIGMPWMFPYLGVGAGYEWTHWTNIHAYGINSANRLDTNSITGNFGYQGIVGVSFPIPMVPGLSLTLDYRFLGVLDPQPAFIGTTAAQSRPNSQYVAANVPHGRGNLVMGNEYAHEVLFGVRYAFGVAPPPPPPAPAPVVTPTPAPARTYLVFFDWDRADLTDRARQIIAEAAQASTHVRYTRIEVNGYTDRSGTPQYNLRLSMRRAQNVAAELVRDGVPRNVINIHGYGESHPLVPTAPGVREPQNRRVEIILR